MGISTPCHKAHVDEWCAKFSNYKSKWPNHLFRHEPVGNAIVILKAGVLTSRQEAVNNGTLQNDIAPIDIIQNRDDVYSKVRLYFRPRTPTQYHIEGIRKPADFYMEKHAGFLVMLVFNSEAVLTKKSTQFSCGNMQSPNSNIYDGDAGFRNLDFTGTYHDEAYPSDDQKRQRCAEVLAESPMRISDSLSAIVVRTDADYNTMKYLLNREGLTHLVPLVQKSEGTGVFFQRFTAVQYVDTAPGRINYKLKGTASAGDIQTIITVYSDASDTQYNLYSGELRPYQSYFTPHNLPAGDYRLSFTLEGCFAYENLVSLQPSS